MSLISVSLSKCYSKSKTAFSVFLLSMSNVIHLEWWWSLVYVVRRPQSHYPLFFTLFFKHCLMQCRKLAFLLSVPIYQSITRKLNKWALLTWWNNDSMKWLEFLCKYVEIKERSRTTNCGCRGRVRVNSTKGRAQMRY